MGDGKKRPREGGAALNCLACRARKRSCDRKLPACSRCAAAGHGCAYPTGDGDGDADAPLPPRRKVACNSCRSARKTCEGEEAAGGGACARCRAKELPCVFPAKGEKGFRSAGASRSANRAGSGSATTDGEYQERGVSDHHLSSSSAGTAVQGYPHPQAGQWAGYSQQHPDYNAYAGQHLPPVFPDADHGRGGGLLPNRYRAPQFQHAEQVQLPDPSTGRLHTFADQFAAELPRGGGGAAGGWDRGGSGEFGRHEPPQASWDSAGRGAEEQTYSEWESANHGWGWNPAWEGGNPVPGVPQATWDGNPSGDAEQAQQQDAGGWAPEPDPDPAPAPAPPEPTSANWTLASPSLPNQTPARTAPPRRSASLALPPSPARPVLSASTSDPGQLPAPLASAQLALPLPPGAPAGAPTPTAQFLFSLLPDFLESADVLYPVFHAPTFLDAVRAGRAPGLALRAVLLAALRLAYDNGDPLLRDGALVRSTELSLFADLRGEVARVASSGVRSLPARERPSAVGGLAYLVIWCLHTAMLEVAGEMSALAAQWAREAGLPAMGRRTWDEACTAWLGVRTMDEARAVPLSRERLLALRAEYTEHIVPSRICILLANMAGQRRDWTRREEPVLSELFDVLASPCYAVTRASADEGWDARTAPPVPMISDVAAWMSMEPGSEGRSKALARLPGHIIGVRNACPVLFHMLRAHADAFLAECRAGGVRSPFLLGTGTAGPEEGRLLALRARVDSAFVDAIAAFPPAVRGDASALVRALEPAHGFYHAWGQAHFLLAVPVVRLELYSSFGAFLLESGADGVGEGVLDMGEAVASEIGSGGVFAGLLNDIIHSTQVLRQLLELNPGLLRALPLAGPLALRLTLLTTFLYHRVQPLRGRGAVDDRLVADLADDARTAFAALEAMAARWPRSLLPGQLAFARKVAARAVVTEAEVDEAHGRVGTGERANSEAAMALGELLKAAYGGGA